MCVKYLRTNKKHVQRHSSFTFNTHLINNYLIILLSTRECCWGIQSYIVAMVYNEMMASTKLNVNK